MLNSLLSMKTNYLGPSLLFGEIANRFEKEALDQSLEYHRLLEIGAEHQIIFMGRQSQVFRHFYLASEIDLINQIFLS